MRSREPSRGHESSFVIEGDPCDLEVEAGFAPMAKALMTPGTPLSLPPPTLSTSNSL